MNEQKSKQRGLKEATSLVLSLVATFLALGVFLSQTEAGWHLADLILSQIQGGLVAALSMILIFTATVFIIAGILNWVVLKSLVSRVKDSKDSKDN